MLCPSIALGHPGKTDRRGGHRCRRGCADWNLDYGEYHFHDKDFMPIRVKKVAVAPSLAASRRTPQEPAASAVSVDTVTDRGKNGLEKTIDESRRSASSVSSAVEETIAPAGGCDLVLSALFFLLLAVFVSGRQRIRRREDR